MGLRINTNLLAMNALGNLQKNNAMFAKSVERLSSGLRINSGADDPSGLIAASSYEQVLAGMEQAIRNNQDSINYAKTAEGALDEVSRLITDARSLAVQAMNGTTLTDAQKQAIQNQYSSIVQAVDKVAGNAAFGTRKILNGSTGVNASTISAANVASARFDSGQLESTAGVISAITADDLTVTVNRTTAATKITTTGTVTYAAATTSLGSARTFIVNGKQFEFSASQTVQDFLNAINNSSGETGVSANYDAANGEIEITAIDFGSGDKGKVNITDVSGLMLAAGTVSNRTGVDAVALVTVGSVTATFSSGKGLELKDKFGNTIKLTEAGNTVASNDWVAITVQGSAQFFTGYSSGDTANLALGNYASSNLGTGVVASKNFSNLDLTTVSGATDALAVIDKAKDVISEVRGRIGNFQRNILESSVNRLNNAKQNLAATLSTVKDLDVAQEMTNFTKLQILQQAGNSVLAQANSAPQSVLALLRG